MQARPSALGLPSVQAPPQLAWPVRPQGSHRPEPLHDCRFGPMSAHPTPPVDGPQPSTHRPCPPANARSQYRPLVGLPQRAFEAAWSSCSLQPLPGRYSQSSTPPFIVVARNAFGEAKTSPRTAVSVVQNLSSVGWACGIE
jgi:hypothetical protein